MKERLVDDVIFPIIDNQIARFEIDYHLHHDVNSILEKAGGFGKFQFFTMLAVILWNQGVGFFLFGLPFLELVPKLMWYNEISKDFQVWNTSDIWIDGMLIDKSKWYVDYTDSMSYHNWMTDLELYWNSSFMIGLFGSAFFIGFTTSGIILKQTDKYGRK